MAEDSDEIAKKLSPGNIGQQHHCFGMAECSLSWLERFSSGSLDCKKSLQNHRDSKVSKSTCGSMMLLVMFLGMLQALKLLGQSFCGGAGGHNYHNNFIDFCQI